MIKLIYSNSQILVVYKESNLPSCPLKNDSSDNLVYRVSKYYPEVLKVKGPQEWEGGILHRLDTLTRGLVLFARDQDAYDFLFSQQKSDRIVKEYRATVSDKRVELPGFPTYPFIDIQAGFSTIVSSFRSYGKKGSSVRPLVNKEGMKIYQTEVVREEENTYICSLTRGFRHQVRCHLAWAGYPICMDTLYGSLSKGPFGLEAIGLSFTDPESNSVLSIKI